MKKVIATKNAPAAIGPYSQAVQVGNMLFASGQLGIDPATGLFVELYTCIQRIGCGISQPFPGRGRERGYRPEIGCAEALSNGRNAADAE